MTIGHRLGSWSASKCISTDFSRVVYININLKFLDMMNCSFASHINDNSSHNINNNNLFCDKHKAWRFAVD